MEYSETHLGHNDFKGKPFNTRQTHSLFQSPENAVEAATAALSTNAGLFALTELTKTGYFAVLRSRSAVGAIG